MVTVLGGLSRSIDDGLAERLRLEVVARTTTTLLQLREVVMERVPLELATRVNTVATFVLGSVMNTR
jgi:hypothetical protein